MTLARVHQVEHRVVSDGTPKARVHQVEHRVVSDGTPKARVHQVEYRIVSSTAEAAVPSSARPVVCVCM